jgi:hypothetical protein
MNPSTGFFGERDEGLPLVCHHERGSPLFLLGQDVSNGCEAIFESYIGLQEFDNQP